MQQSDQELSFNGLQLINQNLLSPACLQSVSNFPNVMLNQQGQLVVGQQSMQAMLLNQQMLNQQLMNQQASPLGQFLPQNQLITTSGQQIYLANLYNLNNGTQKAGQLPMQTIVMAPTNLIPSTIIGTIPNGHQRLNSRKSGGGGGGNTKKSSSSKVSSCSRKSGSKKSKQQPGSKNNGSANGNSKYVERDMEEEEEESENEMYQQMQQDSDQTDNETEDEVEEYEQPSRGVRTGQIRNVYANFEESEDDCDEYDEEMMHDLDNDFEMNDDPNNSSDDEESIRSSRMSLYDDDKFSINSTMSSVPDLTCCVKKERDSDESTSLGVTYTAKDLAELSREDKRALLSEISQFAKQFKMFRTSKDMTQETASKELSRFMKCSQSKLCRFEKYAKEDEKKLEALMDNAKKLSSVLLTKQIFEKYMLLKANKTKEIGEISVGKTRKRRTNFKPEAVQVLKEFFRQNAHPTMEEIEKLSKQTAYSFKEIKVWFNNRRQSCKHQNSD